MNRRNFLGKLLCAAPGVGLLSRVSFSKEKTRKKGYIYAPYIPLYTTPMIVGNPNNLDLLKAITWDYTTDDFDPIAFIYGEPVKIFMWEVVPGELVTPDCKVYKITDQEIPKKLKYSYIRIDPFFVLKCNIKNRWIMYHEVSEFRNPIGESKVKRHERNGYPVVHKLENVRNLTVNLLSPKGDVIATLKGE